METEAGSRQEAVQKIKDMMTPEAVAQHMAEKHPGEPVLSVEEVHAGIEQGVKEE